MATAPYSTGNRVYRGTSFAPHLGTLNPTGYITRGIRQSRQRSGLAAAALAKRNVNTNYSPTFSPHHFAATQGMLSTNPIGRIRLNSGPPIPVQAGQPNFQGTSNAQGTGTNDVLPFDPATALQQDQLQGNRDSALDKLNQLRQQLMETTTSKERALNQAAPELARQLLDRYAGHGMAFSSGYGYGVGQQKQNLADQLAELSRQQSEGMAGYDQQTSDINNQYQRALADLQFASANNLANQAGTLGLGDITANNPMAPGSPAQNVGNGQNRTPSGLLLPPNQVRGPAVVAGRVLSRKAPAKKPTINLSKLRRRL